MKKSLFKGTIYAVSLLCFISIPVSASELEQVQQEKQQIENQLSEAKTNKEQYQAQYYDANNQLQYVISVQNWAYQELEVNQENVQRLVGEIDQLSGVIDKTTADYNRKTDQLKDRLRVM
ncbi:MAG TPA: hypothetical protein DD727_00265 [Clostridiales bacterium]|nr:hypothetical protein [Clostridiales bacterium]